MTTIALTPALAPARRPARSAAAPRTSVRLELTRRGRALRTLAILIAMAALAFVLLATTGAPAAIADWMSGPELVSVTVQPGDTLWSFAEEYGAAGADPRDVVLEIQRINDLPSMQVTAGTQIDIPVSDPAQG